MAVTLKEITGQIDNFLHQVPDRYGMQAELSTIQTNQDNQAKHDLVKEQFKKIIFSELTDCVNTINDLTHTELTIEALQLRLLRIGMDLEQNNKGSIHVDLACLQDLSKVLGINDIEDNVKHQIAYASIAYFIARGCTVPETLENFALTKQVLQQGGRLPFAIIDVDFIKIYYAFCLVLSSFKTDNIIVHAAYDDLSVQDRIGNRIFEAGILSYAIRAVSFLTLLNLEDQIGVIVAYSAISATGYKRSQLCEPNYIEQAINFTTNEVKQEIIKRNISVSMFKYGNSTEAMRKAANEMMQLAFPEVAEKSAKLEATKEAIKDAQAYIHTVEEELERKLKEIDAHYRAIERQTISNINTQIAQAKRDAHSRSFRNTLTQVGIGVVTYFAGPIIGGAVQGMVNSGKLKDFVKAIAINLATGKMMGQLKVPNLTATTTTGTLQVGTRMLAAQNALLNSATHMAVSAVVNGKGKLDLVGMIAAGAGGAAGATMTDGFGKVVIERGVQAATSTLVHGGGLVHNIGAGIIDGAAFHAGTRMAAGLTNTVETLGSTRKAKHKDSESELARENKIDEKLIKQWTKLTEQQKLELILLQEEKANLSKQIAAKLHDYGKQQSLLGNSFDIQAAFETMQDVIKLMDSKQFKQFKKDFTLFALKESQFSQPKLKLTAFVASGGRDGSESPKKDWWQTIKELKDNYVKITLDSDTVEQDLYRSYSIATLDKSKLLYSRWQEARSIYFAEMSSLYGDNALDPDIYIQQAQSKWILDHLTIGERRYNFNPGNPVLYNSVGLTAFQEKIYSTYAYDLCRLGNENFSVGATGFIVAKGTFSPLELKNSKLNSNAKINIHTGANVLQVKFSCLHANVNIYSCALEGKVGDFLPDGTPNLSSSINQSCSKAEVLFTLKKEPICVWDTCLQAEGNVSLRFGIVGSKTKFDSQSNPGYSVQSNAHIEITKKPKPS